MKSDIDNWVNFLNDTMSKANIGTDINFTEDSVIRDLKLTAIPMLNQFIGDIKGRHLTNLLTNLEKSFTLLGKQLKKEKNLDNFRKLSFLALSDVIVDILREMRVAAYTEGKDFDPIAYLDEYEEEVKLEYEKTFSKKSIKSKKSKKLKNKKKKIVEEEETIEDDSEEEEDDEYIPTYLDDNDDDEEEDEEDDDEEEEEEDEEEEDEEEDDDDDDDEEDDEYIEYTKEGYEKDDFVVDDNNITGKRKKRNYIIVYSKGDKRKEPKQKKSKLDIEFIKSLSTSLAPKSYEEQALTHFTKFEEEQKQEFLNKFKAITEADSNSEPVLFKIVNLDLPEDQKNNILTEYMNIENSMSEKSKLKSWLENLLKIPFGKQTGINLENLQNVNDIKNFINKLQTRMNEAVFGHNEAKKKIIEIMAQYISNPDSKGNCLGIWGPPGNGKTTLIKEGIAKAMDRSFVFISLGGASDASFLEGHSYTYEGSIYGRIAQGLMKSDCMNPIIYFDELDKISNTPKGQEITNLLVHLTDPAQNSEFMDKYFYNVKLDLSKATFIFSYNDPHKVDPILRDRITQVETKYLLTSQKIKIAQNYLLPSILTDMGLNSNDIQFQDDDIRHIITEYTLEGGVRKLKSILYSIIRQLNILHLTQESLDSDKVEWPFTVSSGHFEYLLKDYYKTDEQKIHTESKVGVINGLFAMTLGIGGILPIESQWIPAEHKNYVKKTGSLESVIKESIDVAHTLAWHYVDDNTKNQFEKKFKKNPVGIHLHCPDGATPKDGPSAGTALTVLFYSRFMNKKIRNDIAITGEINLQGNVTRIGGLEQKLQGAKRAGVKLALIPRSNMIDLDKIKVRNPNLLDKTFKVIDVDHIEDVFEHVFSN